MSILKTNQITDLGGNELLTSNGSGVISSGGAITNTPMFRAKLTSSQSIASGAYTKINLDGVSFDSDNVFDTSTYKFTVPSGQSGKYSVGYSIGTDAAIDDGERLIGRIYRNGTGLNYTTSNDWASGSTRDLFVNYSVNIDLSVGDYLELYMFHNEGGAINCNPSYTRLWGYKLIGA